MNWYLCGLRFLKSNQMFPPAGVYSAALVRRCIRICDTYSLLILTFILGALTVKVTLLFNLSRTSSFRFSQNCWICTSSNSNSVSALFWSSDNVWIRFEKSSKAFTSGIRPSSFCSVGSNWAEILLINLAFSASLSWAILMVFFCLRVNKMKRISTTPPTTNAAASAPARTQRPIMMAERKVNELSFSEIAASLSAICCFKAFISSACFKAFAESFHAI